MTDRVNFWTECVKALFVLLAVTACGVLALGQEPQVPPDAVLAAPAGDEADGSSEELIWTTDIVLEPDPLVAGEWDETPPEKRGKALGEMPWCIPQQLGPEDDGCVPTYLAASSCFLCE